MLTPAQILQKLRDAAAQSGRVLRQLNEEAQDMRANPQFMAELDRTHAEILRRIRALETQHPVFASRH